jgi:peroxiredoxin
MKKSSFIASIAILALSMLIFVTFNKHLTQKAARNQMQMRHKLPIVLLEETSFSKTLTSENQFTIIIYYNSECQLCDDQIAQFSKHFSALTKNSTILFVSAESEDSIRNFRNRLRVSSTNKVFFSKISEQEVFKTFGSVVTPQVFLYRQDQLLKTFNGELIIDSILKCMDLEGEDF